MKLKVTDQCESAGQQLSAWNGADLTSDGARLAELEALELFFG